MAEIDIQTGDRPRSRHSPGVIGGRRIVRPIAIKISVEIDSVIVAGFDNVPYFDIEIGVGDTVKPVVADSLTG